METRYLFILRLILGISDLILINLCFFVTTALLGKFSGAALETYTQTAIVINLMWLLSSNLFKLYSNHITHTIELIYRATWRAVCLHSFLFMLYLFFGNKVQASGDWLITFYIFLGTGMLLSRFTGTAIQQMLFKKFPFRKTVAVLGSNSGGLRLAALLEKQEGVNFLGFLNNEGLNKDILQDVDTLSIAKQMRVAANSGVSEVFVSLTPDRIEEIPLLMLESEKQCVRLKLVPDFTSGYSNFNLQHFGGFPVLTARREPLEDIDNRVRKRLFDIVVSLGVIVFILSWLYPIIAIIIKCQNPGPVLFKQLRSGRDNKSFWCYKFRSMKMNDQSNHKQASKNDDRITAIGKFMRKTSIDELPQFFNVLIGDMSVVGPRPHMLSHTQQYRSLIDKYMVRHFLKPGISGWAQVNGYRGETREQWLMEKRVEHDIWYLENWSAMLDVKIVFMTIINAVKGEKNAY